MTTEATAVAFALSAGSTLAGPNDGVFGQSNVSAQQSSGNNDDTFNLNVSIAIVTFVTPVALFGLVGNAVVLLTFCLPSAGPLSASLSLSIRRQKWRATSTSVFITTLAVCDELTIVVCTVYELLQLALAAGREADSGWSASSVAVICAALLWIIQLMITWSTWLIAAIAYFRYCVVSRPDETAATCCVAKARKYVLGATVLSLLLSAPAFLRFKVEQYQCSNDTRYDFQLNDFTDYTVYKVLYSYIIYFTFSYFVPIGLLVFLSVKLIASLLESRNISKSMVATTYSIARARRRQIKVTKVTIAIAMLNIICMAPSFAQAVVREEAGVGSSSYRIIASVARSLLLVASAVDCILFSFVNKSFRRRLRLGTSTVALRASSKIASSAIRWRRSTVHWRRSTAHWRQSGAAADSLSAPRACT